MLTFFIKRKYSLVSETMAGITTAISILPECIMYAYLAGLSPQIGIITAMIAGIVYLFITGKPGMIVGPARATSIIMVFVAAEYGVPALSLTIVIAGLLQLLLGFLKLGKLIRLIPRPVILGFLNGMAINLFIQLLDIFKFDLDNILVWLDLEQLLIMATIVVSVVVAINYLPKITIRIPASLIVIVTGATVVYLFDIETPSLNDFFLNRGGGDMSYEKPSLALYLAEIVDLDTVINILPYAMLIAMTGLMQSLLMLTVVDELSGERGRGNIECLAQGGVNIITGILGGMGTATMYSATILNFKSGGKGRVSMLVFVLTLIVIYLFFDIISSLLPLAILGGVVFMVAMGTFSWGSLRLINKEEKSEGLVLILVTGATILFNLTFAVLAGILITALIFAWDSAKRIRVRKKVIDDETKVYEIYGPLFFASSLYFIDKFETEHETHNNIIFDFYESRIWDHSGVEALKKVIDAYLLSGKNVSLKHLSPDSVKILNSLLKSEQIRFIKSEDDPNYVISLDEVDIV